MRRGSSEVITGDWDFKGKVTFREAAIFKKAPFGREQIYTPIFTGFGTPSSVNFHWVRLGNRIFVNGRWTCGTTTAVEARISLPGAFMSDGALVTAIEVCGNAVHSVNGANYFACLIGSGLGYINIGLGNAANNTLTPIASTSAIFSSGQTLSVAFNFPISGWNV